VKIELKQAGKKYLREWIFRNASLSIHPSEKVVILGPNGSGKSTLLQLFSGSLLPTEGKVTHSDEGQAIEPESVFRKLTYAAPYLELIEEFTLEELINFHFSFKSPLYRMKYREILDHSGLASSEKKVFRYFSSGMKQRVKLALAIFSDVDLLLLDEPCSNLDSAAIQWYQNLVSVHAGGRTIIVCSNNQAEEYSFCDRRIMMADLKMMQ
jgi:ABC-type multidrug transport system ATPase subunit